MRREPSPADRAGQAEMVEHLGRVVGDAPLQNLLFPGVGGGFETLQWPNDFERAALAERACVPGATCCQRSSQRMNCAGVTGWICLRNSPRVRR